MDLLAIALATTGLLVAKNVPGWGWFLGALLVGSALSVAEMRGERKRDRGSR